MELVFNVWWFSFGSYFTWDVLFIDQKRMQGCAWCLHSKSQPIFCLSAQNVLFNTTTLLCFWIRPYPERNITTNLYSFFLFSFTESFSCICSSSLMPIKSLKWRWKVLLTAEQRIISALSIPITLFQNYGFFSALKNSEPLSFWWFQVLAWNMLGQALNYDLFLHYKFIACGCLSCCNASLHGWQDSTLASFHCLPVVDWAEHFLFSGRAREMCWAETKHITL